MYQTNKQNPINQKKPPKKQQKNKPFIYCDRIGGFETLFPHHSSVYFPGLVY